MTRETRIALLVGLAFIVLFGLVLGQRSLNLQNQSTGINMTRTLPGTTVVPVGSATPAPVATPAPAPVHAPLLPGPSPEVAGAGNPLTPHAMPAPAPTPVTGNPPPGTTGAMGSGIAIAPGVTAPPSRLPVAPPKPTDVAFGPTGITRASELKQELPQPVIPPVVAATTYEVQPGDTLYKIARKVYGQGHENDYTKIYKANQDKIPASYALSVGEKLAIPDAPATAMAPALAPAPAKPGLKDMVAKGKKDATIGDLKAAAGDKTEKSDPPTLIVNSNPDASVLRTPDSPKITNTPKAKEVSPKDLVAAKDLKTKLTPGSTDSPAAPATAKKYVIKSGDSLAVIARNLLGDSSRAAMQKIMDANRDRIKDPNQLKIGTELRIPQA